jgi:hypothetical protein
MEYSLNLDSLNSEMSIGFDSLNSEMSIGTDNNSDAYTSKNNLNTQRGGFFWGSNKVGGDLSNANNSKILLAAKEKNYNVVSFMVKNNMVSDFSCKDQDQNSLLHYLAAGGGNTEALTVAKLIVNSSNVKNFINLQNGSGDTPLHVAVKNGCTGFASLLDSCGCDKKTENKDGFAVGVESESLAGGGLSSKSSLSKSQNTFFPFNFTQNSSNTRETSFEPMSLNTHKNTQNTTQSTTNSTDAFIKNIVSKYNNYDMQDESILDGGAKKRSTKSKKSSKKSKKIKRNSGYELSRLISRQSNEIHDRVKEKIFELMKLDKNNEKDQEIMKNYKAVLWRLMMKEHPELTSNLDKSVQLEKMTTLEILKDIDPKKGIAYREESRQKRDELNASKPGSKTGSETSEEEKKPKKAKKTSVKAIKAKK